MWGPFYCGPALPYHLLRILTQTWLRVLGEPLKAELKLRQVLRNQIARMTNGGRDGYHMHHELLEPLFLTAKRAKFEAPR